MAYTNTACPTVNRNRVSNSFFGLVLSRKFSPVNLDRNMPKYTILPVFFAGYSLSETNIFLARPETDFLSSLDKCSK